MNISDVGPILFISSGSVNAHKAKKGVHEHFEGAFYQKDKWSEVHHVHKAPDLIETKDDTIDHIRSQKLSAVIFYDPHIILRNIESALREIIQKCADKGISFTIIDELPDHISEEALTSSWKELGVDCWMRPVGRPLTPEMAVNIAESVARKCITRPVRTPETGKALGVNKSGQKPEA